MRNAFAKSLCEKKKCSVAFLLKIIKKKKKQHIFCKHQMTHKVPKSSHYSQFTEENYG
jgi:hypothetical protein